MPIASTFGPNGYGMPVYPSSHSTAFTCESRAKIAWSAVPLGSQTRQSIPVVVRAPGVASYGPTVNASRYEDITGVSRKTVRWRPVAAASVRSTGMFDMAARVASWISSTVNRALNSGSSKQGNARRASAASNCVTA